MRNRCFHPVKSVTFCLLVFVFTGIVFGYLFLQSTAPAYIPGSITYVTVCETDEPCHEKGLPYQDASLPIEARLDDLMGRMTLAEKIGQMTLIEKNSINDLDAIAKYGLGALLSGAGGNPMDNTPKGWLQMVQAFQASSQKTRLRIPLLYGVDANHGHGNIPGATLFPHSIGLGASHDPILVQAVARATAEEVAATGVQWVFSPDLDVAQDIRWGRTYETFGSDPILAGSLGRAFIDGLQSFDQDGLKVASAAKHYVGNGSMTWGSSTNKDYLIDRGNSDISEAELRQTHLEPFKQAIKSDVKSMMVGLNNWHGEKVTFNRYLLTDVLRTELGYQGFIFSDWYGVYENEWNKYQALVKAINAGIDMVMLPFDYEIFSADMHRAVANGDISQTRVDEAVRRIVRVKFALGLFDAPLNQASHLDRIGSQAHRELARIAVRKSLVLLKNTHTVPLSKTTARQILVSGSAANNIGKQSGGWTVEWQGIDGNWIPGTTILKGIQNAVSSSTNVKYSLDGNFSDQKGLADVGIAVVGEAPYSEGVGDRADLTLSAEDLNAIRSLQKVSKKIIVIIVSGRPLDISARAKDWDAIIAAWLPGSEGQGVADVLFGEFPFMGTLPVAWDF